MIAIEYAISSILMMITIIGIPFGLQTMKLAAVALWPFGTDITSDGWPSVSCRNNECDMVVSRWSWHRIDSSWMGIAILHNNHRNTFRTSAFQTNEARLIPIRQND